MTVATISLAPFWRGSKPVGQHERFLARLGRSREAVEVVASWLRECGHLVDVPAMQWADNVADAQQYRDHGDILLPDRGQRVEVKRISRVFGGRGTWPFRECFVSNAAAVARAGAGVLAYVTLSDDLLCAAIVVPGESRSHWYEVERRASNTGNVERFVACPLELVRFCCVGAIPPRLAERAVFTDALLAGHPNGDDGEGRFVHYCFCGTRGSFGFPGDRWFCREHREMGERAP